jgi:YqaJ-like viral recombinase domain
MIIHDMPQGSPEWLTARLGIPTSSEFHRIITAVKGDLSKSARKYAHQLVAETLLGEPIESSIGNLDWVVRGKLLEPQAVQQYEFTTDVETRAVGFVTTDCGRLGCSPDRLIVGARGALEIKCCSPSVHVGYMADGPGEDYKQQCQGQLAIAELEWVDLYAYHPRLRPVTIRTVRDEPYITKMRAALAEFLDLRDAMLVQARASGFFEAQKEAA